MKPEPCDKYKKPIEQYTCNELNSGKTKLLLEHIEHCTACRAYLDALHHTEQTMVRWIESLEPSIEAGQTQTISRLRQIPQLHDRTVGISSRRRWIGYAAAACILMIAGFLTGRGLRPSLDVDELGRQWIASIQPQMENRITASVVQTLRPQIVGEYAKLQNALSGQITSELQAYAEQTVLRNDRQMYGLLTQLIEAIQTAQVQNQQWALSAMEKLEQRRLLDQEQTRNDLAAFAVYTGNELLRTQQKLETLTNNQN